MDRQTMGVLIPVIFMFFSGLIAFSFTRLGKAVAKRIEGNSDEGLRDRVERLEADNEMLHRALTEAHDRLDQNDRLLAREASRPLR